VSTSAVFSWSHVSALQWYFRLSSGSLERGQCTSRIAHFSNQFVHSLIPLSFASFRNLQTLFNMSNYRTDVEMKEIDAEELALCYDFFLPFYSQVSS
jgi:hypothetical protein